MNQSVQRNVIRVLNVAELRYDYNLSFTAGRPVFLEVRLIMWSLLVVLNVPPFQIWPTSLRCTWNFWTKTVVFSFPSKSKSTFFLKVLSETIVLGRVYFLKISRRLFF